MTRISRSRLLVCAVGCAGVLVSRTPAFAQTAPRAASAPVAAAVPEGVALPAPQAPLTGGPRASSPNILADLVGDFRNLASRDTATWLGIGAGIALVGHVGDRSATHALAGSAGLHEAFESGQTLGGTPLQLGGAFATYAIGRIAGSSRTATVGSELFRAGIVAQTLTSVMKVSAGRSRPDGQSHSFPSGHAASAFASATVLQRNFGWKVGIPAYALASYVGVSRIQTQRHYLSDVAFGAAIGILAGRTVTVGTSTTRFAVEPFAVAGGGGVSFNLVRKQ